MLSLTLTYSEDHTVLDLCSVNLTMAYVWRKIKLDEFLNN